MKFNPSFTEQLINEAYLNGGTTMCKHGEIPTEGYVVGEKTLYKGPFPEVLNVKEIAALIKTSEGNFFGSWKDKDGLLYIDEVEIYHSLDVAVHVAKKRKEKAIYSLRSKEEIFIMSGERIKDEALDP